VLSKRYIALKWTQIFDNVPMLKILDKLSYSYCGEIFFSGAPRKAFEKVISKSMD